MAYSSWSVVFGEQPSATKWNILGTNDASFNDGTGIGSATITADKLATGGASASVITSQTTTSTSYTDLATTTDTVTVTIGANGLALVSLSVYCFGNTNAQNVYASFAGSGANTIAASDAFAVAFGVPTTGAGMLLQSSIAKLITGLTPGSTTFKMKYKTSVGTGTWSNRTISVIPL
jgi:hypothetical protein